MVRNVSLIEEHDSGKMHKLNFSSKMHTISVRKPLLTPVLFNYFLIFFSIVLFYVVPIVISFLYDCNLNYFVSLYIYIFYFVQGSIKISS